jgi:acetyl esterase/lipase
MTRSDVNLLTSISFNSILKLAFLSLPCASTSHRMHMDKNQPNRAAPDGTSRAGTDGTVQISNLRVPFSAFASEQARQTFLNGLAPPPEGANDVAALRAHYGAFNDRLRDRMLELFKVEVVETKIGGVPVHRVTPAARHDDSGRVLLNLHGGAFMWGSGSGALVEAIPVAATSGLPVIAVDYRMAPEHTFPAASDDVQAVYEALLAGVPARAIGIYGCSAGALLAAQCVAQFLAHGLPLPGGISMLCGTGLLPVGDSAFTSGALSGEQLDGDATAGDAIMQVLKNYFGATPPDDPRVFPGSDTRVISQFPPSQFIAGTRDFAASGVTTMHRRLIAHGVDAELFLFDGLWHAFQIFPDLPESTEVYGLLARFFNRTLSAKAQERGR